MFGIDEYITLRLPVQFLHGHDAVLQKVALIGRANGMDSDWRPPSIQEAILEAACYASTPEECGMIFRDPASPESPGIFPGFVTIGLHRKIGDIYKENLPALPAGFRDDIQGVLLGLVNSSGAPNDYGFSILNMLNAAPPKSAHARLALHKRVDDGRWSGARDRLFVP